MGQADVFGLGDGVPRLRRGLRVTHLGDERLVLDPASGVVHTVRGPAVRALDAVRRGRLDVADEVVAALAAAEIIEVPGMSRRDFGLIAGAASAFVLSAVLPSALAAASGLDYSVTGTGGELRQFTVSDGAITYDLYRLADTNFETSSLSRTFALTSTARQVQILLVGAGGAGGSGVPVTDSRYSTSYAGGGGGGEVVEVDLGTVPGSTSFVVTVAGATEPSSTTGSSSYVTIGVTDIVIAKGGGRGASHDSAAVVGGSGGGGSSFSTSGASSNGGSSTNHDGVSPTVVQRYHNSGGNGAGTAGGGGGGALPSDVGIGGVGSAASGTSGGNGGPGVDMSNFLKTYTSVAGDDPGDYPIVLGGGGGGSGSGGVESRGVGGTGGGGSGGFTTGDNQAAAADFGVAATGGGGGAGASVALSTNTRVGAVASTGWGGSGVAWVRIRR